MTKKQFFSTPELIILADMYEIMFSFECGKITIPLGRYNINTVKSEEINQNHSIITFVLG